MTVAEPNAWVPEGVDITVPNASRVYDYALGGVNNFRVDREFWKQVEQVIPDARLIAQANRAFLGRAVEWLTQCGIRQFLDLGSGIPTLGNVHEVAQESDPAARVVYVDIDPVAVAHSRHLLKDNPYAIALRGDLRDPVAILQSPEVLDFLDFAEPIAVLMVAVLHFVPDTADPRSIIAQIAAVLNPGSFLVVSHVGPEATEDGRERQETVRKLYEQTPTPLVIRDAGEVAALFGDDKFALLDPGVVSADRWHPDPEDRDDPPQPTVLVAVGRRT